MSPFEICGDRCTGMAVATVETLAEALDARDPYTAGHSLRVAEYARAIASALGVSDHDRHLIRVAAQLHDIGKIGIPDAVLLKADPLTAEQWGLIKLHPQIGRRILERGQFCEALLATVEQHHENFDGSGYPFGALADRIPLGARIIRVADAFDAMTTDRAYRFARTAEQAIQEIRSGIGRQFDPLCASTLITLVERAENTRWALPASGLLAQEPPGVVKLPA